MKLRTEIPHSKSDFDIDHRATILLLGSCFAENIGQKLEEHKFITLRNPLGISYNPISLSQLIQRENDFNLDDYNLENELYFNYQLYSEFSDLENKKAVLKANKALKMQQDFFKKCKVVFISLGTAWVHELESNQEIVNNCHKQKASLFSKRLLSVSETITALSEVVTFVSNKTQNQAQVVFTVSPIRHLKDGFHENQLSKSTLQLAVNEVCKKQINVAYFPSYEILIDDLRDYRFYETDLVHPNKLAIEYIWNKFSEVFFSENTKNLNVRIESFNASIQHRPFNKKSNQYQVFIRNLIQQINVFQEKEHIDFEVELKILNLELLPQ